METLPLFFYSMYVGYNKIFTVYGSVYGDTLLIESEGTPIRLPLQKKLKTKKTGYIQFIRKANGVCEILHIVED